MAERFRLGLDTYSYHIASPVWPPAPPEPLTLEGYLDRAAELGLDGLALADMGHFTSTAGEAVAALKARAEGLGLYVELGTGGIDVDHLSSALRLARQFGGSVLRTFVSIGKTWSGDEPYRCGLKRAAAALRRAAETCEDTGVALAVENHQDLTGPELAEVLDRVDHPLVGACWDTGNSLGVLEHPLEGLRYVADRTLTVHLKSYVVLPPPEGQPGGYALLGVPVEHNRDMLRETIAVLSRHSPAEQLHLNVEAAVEYIPVTPSRRGWRAEHAEAAERVVEACGAATADRDATQRALAAWLPRPDLSIQEALSLEDRLVRASVAQARELINEMA